VAVGRDVSSVHVASQAQRVQLNFNIRPDASGKGWHSRWLRSVFDTSAAVPQPVAIGITPLLRIVSVHGDTYRRHTEFSPNTVASTGLEGAVGLRSSSLLSSVLETLVGAATESSLATGDAKASKKSAGKGAVNTVGNGLENNVDVWCAVAVLAWSHRIEREEPGSCGLEASLDWLLYHAIQRPVQNKQQQDLASQRQQKWLEAALCVLSRSPNFHCVLVGCLRKVHSKFWLHVFRILGTSPLRLFWRLLCTGNATSLTSAANALHVVLRYHGMVTAHKAALELQSRIASFNASQTADLRVPSHVSCGVRTFAEAAETELAAKQR
jgi:hypothetical protein